MHIELRTLGERRLLLSALTAVILIALLAFLLGSPVWGGTGKSSRVEPEYERKLDKVVLSIAVNTRDLSLHSDIIKQLPEYTEILMILPDNKLKKMSKAVKSLGAKKRVRLIPFDTTRLKNTNAYVLSSRNRKLKYVRKDFSVPSGSIWAQDLFEVVSSSDGFSSLIAPYMHKWFVRPKGGKAVRDNHFLESLLSRKVSLRRLPLVFKGGNVLVDELRGKRIAFVGGDVIRETMMVSEKALGKKVSKPYIIRKLRQYLGVDQVVIMGDNLKQPLKMFHLDQAMVLLPGGRAAVTRIVDFGMSLGDSEVYSVNIFLDEVRRKLNRLGYMIVDIGASVDDVKDFRYYVNGVPYVNRLSGKREFLMPLFETSLKGINREIYDGNVSALESIGYRVIPIHTHANEHHGGIHCLVNVIS